MTDLKNSRFYDLLPPNLQDDNALALSFAADRQFNNLIAYIPKVLVLADVDRLDESMCDYIAQNMDIKAYNTAFSLDVKRSLIKIALRLSSKKGTATALQEMLTAIHGGAKVEEWFQYGGEPYRFRVQVDLSGGGSTGITPEIMGQIEAYKNLRSHLEGVEYSAQTDAAAYAGAYPQVGIEMVIHPYVPDAIEEPVLTALMAYPLMGMNLIICAAESEV